MSPPLSRSGLASYPGHVVGGKSDHVAWVRGYKWYGYETSLALKFSLCLFSLNKGTGEAGAPRSSH